jgi:hypothetical protein
MKLETLLLLAMATSAISFTVTSTSIFKSVRESIAERGEKFEELIHCPWCLSHWVAFIIIFISPSSYQFTGVGLFNFFLTGFAMAGISGLMHYVLLRAYEPVAKAMAARQIEKLRNGNKN